MSKSTKSTKKTSNESGLRMLPKGFSPSISEVIIGRGRKVTNHVGNQRFQDLIHSHLYEYQRARSKVSKSAIILHVLQTVKQGSPESVGGFVKQDAKTKRWFALEDAAARISTAQAFRDALSGKYRSSKQYKQQKRWGLTVPLRGSSSSNSSVSSGSSSAGHTDGKTPVEITVSTKTLEPTNAFQLQDAATVQPSFPLQSQLPAPSSGNIVAGLRSILDSAMSIMDEDLFCENPGREAAGPRTASFGGQPDQLGALLERFESQVQWTENPFEPTPLLLAPIHPQQQQQQPWGQSTQNVPVERHRRSTACPVKVLSNKSDFSFSLRNAVAI